MENNKFFLFISRINSILFLIVLFLVTVLIVYVFNEVNRSINNRSVEIATLNKESDEKEVIELSNVNSVYGTDYHVIEAESREDGILKSGGYSRTTRNILFLDPAGNDPRWLFESNDNVILTNRQLTHKNDYYESITDYFYIVIVTNDSNQDGLISALDKKNIAICDPTGENLTFLVKEIERIINYNYNSETKRLELLAQIGHNILYRIYSLKTKSLLTEKMVLNIN